MNDTANIIKNSEKIRDTTSRFLKGKDFELFDEAFRKQTNIDDYTVCSVVLSSESTFEILISYFKECNVTYELWRNDMNTPHIIEKIGQIIRR